MVDYARVSGFGVSEPEWDTYQQAVVSLCEQLLCAPGLFTPETTTLDARVINHTVLLPVWASDITHLTVDGEETSFILPAARQNGYFKKFSTPTSACGECTVTGGFGFTGDSIPSDICFLLAQFVRTLDSISSGDYRVSQKSLEDVQVSFRDSAGSTEWSGFMALVRPVVARWGLCANSDPSGCLAYSEPIVDAPWWVSDSSLGVIRGG